MLCDTGPLVALIHKKDANHQRCPKALRGMPIEPLVTTWPCLTEAIYLLGRRGGIQAQNDLWKLIEDGIVQLMTLEPGDWKLIQSKMIQ